MPFQSTCPQLGVTCGRRERESRRVYWGGAILSRCVRRNGRRHLGPGDVGSLRGMPEKPGSRPVRTSLAAGLFLCKRAHRRQRVSSGSHRRGTSSACARRTHSTEGPSRLACPRTRPSLGPETRARQSPLNSRARVRECGAVDSVSRSGKLAQARGTGTGIGSIGRMRGSPPVTALREKRSRVTRTKRKEVAASIPARKRESRFEPVRREQLQKSAGGTWPRISSCAALQKEWRHE